MLKTKNRVCLIALTKCPFGAKKSPQNTYNLMKSKVVYKNGIFVAFLVVIYFVLYRIALWVCFGDAIVQGTGSKFVPQNSPKIQFDATPSCWSPVQPGNGRFKKATFTSNLFDLQVAAEISVQNAPPWSIWSSERI